MTRSDEIRRRALDLLDELGGTEEAVAASLIERGIKGGRQQACGCPIYVYLDAAGVPVLVVDDALIGIAGSLPIDTPPAIAEFIHAFDDDRYETWPELVAEVTLS